MRFSARIFASVIFVLVLLAHSFTPFAYAQEANPLSNIVKADAGVPVTVGTLTQGVVIGLLSTATCMLGGVDFATPNHKCLNYNAQTQSFGYAQDSGGLLGMVMGGIELTYNAPIHTSDYLSYLSHNFGVAKRAQAQGTGIGFDQLSPITKLWLAFRNLAYLIFVIIFVVIGFAVMLRAKIDPRTVMTIENQIPKLIVALILITFSFAIAGFVIDIMWVGIYLVINLFANLDPVLHQQLGAISSTVKSDPFSWVNTLNKGPLGFMGIAQQAAGAIKDITNQIILNILNQAPWIKIVFALLSVEGWLTTMGCLITGALTQATNHIISIGGGQSLGDCLNNVLGGIISGMLGSVAFLIFGIILFVAIIKIWWTLLKSYALFLIFVIFGPLIIMSGVIPGWTKTNFEYWLRHVLAYSIVFPTTMGVFLLGKTLMDVYVAQTVTASTPVPPLLGASGVGTGELAFMGPLLGFAVMMLAPQSLAMVQDALNAPDPKYLAGVGAAMSVGSQAYGAFGGKIFHRWTRPADMFHEEGYWRSKFLGKMNKRNWWRRFWVGTERDISPNKT